MKIMIILKFFVWELPKLFIMKWIKICKWEKEMNQFEKEIRRKPKLTLVHTCSNCKQKEEIDISRIVERFKRAWERIVVRGKKNK